MWSRCARRVVLEHPHVRFSRSRTFFVSGLFDNHIASVGIFIKAKL